jgi:hypothetical protein
VPDLIVGEIDQTDFGFVCTVNKATFMTSTGIFILVSGLD